MSRITATAGTFLKSLFDVALKAVEALLGKLTTSWVLLPVLAVGAWYLYDYGDKHGANARAYAAVVAELKAKNAELEKLAREDARIAAAEATKDAAAREAFQAVLPKLKKCRLDAAQVDALNKMIGD